MEIILQTFHPSVDGKSEREVAEGLAAKLKEAYPTWKMEVQEQLHKFEKQKFEFTTYNLVINREDTKEKAMVKAFRHSLFCNHYIINGKMYNTEYYIRTMWAYRQAVNQILNK